MPKRYAVRPIAERGEVNLARRIERLRRDRGWSFETLAKQMTDAGCSISKAALYSIEEGDPPRRITVDELMAFAEVFTNGDVAEMLKPPELVDQQRAHELIEEIRQGVADFADHASASFNALWKLYELAYENRDLAEYVANHLDSGTPGRYKLDTHDVDSPEGEVVADLALLRAVKANYDHTLEMRKSAAMWAAYRNGNWTTKDQQRAESELARLRKELEVLKIEQDGD